MSMPKGILSVNMENDKCQKCAQKGFGNVHMFRIEFLNDIINEAMREVLPEDEGTTGLFCVNQGCDPNFKVVLEHTYGLL